MVSALNTFRPFLLVLVLSLTAACKPVPADLPPLPTVDSSGLLPGVQRQIDEALADAREKPKDVAKAGRAGAVLHAYRFFVAAEPCYQRARMLAPRKALWADLHGITLESIGQSDAAIAAYRTSLDVDALPQTKVRLAKLLYAVGQQESAETLLKETIVSDPEYVGTYKEFGLQLAQSGNVGEAAKMFEKALALSNGPDKDVYYALAGIYRDLGRDREAQSNLRLFDQHKDRNPTVVDPHMNFVQKQKKDDKTLVRHALRLHQAGDSQAALLSLEEAVNFNPNSVSAYTAMMGIHSDLSDFPAVDASFERARRVAPGDPTIFFNLGIARVREMRLVEAAAAFESALEIDPYHASALTQFGYVKERRKEYGAAVGAYQAAYDLDGNTRALLGLARSLAAENRFEAVVGLFSIAASPVDESDRVEGVLIESRALSALGRNADAQKRIRMSLPEIELPARRTRLEWQLAELEKNDANLAD